VGRGAVDEALHVASGGGDPQGKPSGWRAARILLESAPGSGNSVLSRVLERRLGQPPFNDL